MDNQPFKGLRVLELASVLAGPAVGMFFAELGATVTKIENRETGGDVTRSWKQPAEDPASPISAYWCSVNWGKEHLFLDLYTERDRQTALELAQKADVLISNFKPSSARRMGLDPDALLAQNERLIYAQLNSFADPEDESPAFDMVLQAEAGFLHMCGEPNRPPVRMPVAFVDVLAAHQLKEAILIALLQRERTQKGCFLQTSLIESALSSLMNQASNYLMTGNVPSRMGTQHPNIAPYGDIFTCSDGQQVLLAIGTSRQFAQFCRVIERTDLLEDELFMDNAARVRNRTALLDLLRPVFVQKSLDTWMDLFKRHAVPAARIRDMRQVFEMPIAQQMVLEEMLEDGTVTKRMKTVAFEMTHATSKLPENR
jgi:crotonobetainyl-CoA:carnitine CoA-transferase CaiB-like acyl-CoA transferase